jgi:hypothetical protein
MHKRIDDASSNSTAPVILPDAVRPHPPGVRFRGGCIDILEGDDVPAPTTKAERLSAARAKLDAVLARGRENEAWHALREAGKKAAREAEEADRRESEAAREQARNRPVIWA